ncbi:MAG: hypothetical protein Q8N53_06540 [Longimicrobiales bacterium]|nr:hypothetical protein [Longimicrobiales bacterium]
MRTSIRALALLAGVFLPLTAPAAAQQPPPPPPLRVFLDCERCDFDHLRTVIPVVDWVRDRMDADLHVLVTQQETGAGGSEYTLHFLGLRELSHLADTLSFASRQIDTEEEVREVFTRTFRLGLVRYLAQTSRAGVVDVVFPGEAKEGGPAVPPADDPWNLWVMRASVSGEFQGETRTRSSSFDGSFSASRTTEEFKINMRLSGQYEEDNFEYSSGEKEESSASDLNAELTTVWSLGPHWSWGVSGSAGASTSVNQTLALKAAPALEYSFYPYAESTRRQITVLYRLGMASFRYEDVTLFDKTAETRPEQSMEIAADFTQPWGNLVVSLSGSNYLDDLSKHRVELFTMMEIRIVRGLSLNLEGSVARIKDQIYLSREEVPDEEVLLRRKELGKDYEYSVDVGLSFTFGSVFNNVVNPRLRARERYH